MFAELLLLSGLAEAAGTTFSVTYEAAADCPTQAAFEAAIVARVRPAHEKSMRRPTCASR
jgi:hypothetical protein